MPRSLPALALALLSAAASAAVSPRQAVRDFAARPRAGAAGPADRVLDALAARDAAGGYLVPDAAVDLLIPQLEARGTIKRLPYDAQAESNRAAFVEAYARAGQTALKTLEDEAAAARALGRDAVRAASDRAMLLVFYDGVAERAATLRYQDLYLPMAREAYDWAVAHKAEIEAEIAAVESDPSFPDPSVTLPDDADGGFVAEIDLTPGRLLHAYRKGMFPYAASKASGRTRVFAPERRGVMVLTKRNMDRIRRRMRGEARRADVTLDLSFAEVVARCAAAVRPNGSTPWMSESYIRAAIGAFVAGRAHSVEVRQDGNVVGGSYGFMVDGTYSGESMFYLLPDMGKRAFLETMRFLASRGLTFMDTQVVNKTTGGEWGTRARGTAAAPAPDLRDRGLGAIFVTRERYGRLIAEARRRRAAPAP